MLKYKKGFYLVFCMKKGIPVGTLRIKVNGLKVYEKTKSSWKRSKKSLPNVLKVVKLFKANKNFKVLVDLKDSKFLKGMVFPDGKIRGARVNVLPDGRKLDKVYSIFAKNLIVHDQESNAHWDVMYQNPGGGYAHLYTLEKRDKFVRKKFNLVKKFEKHYPSLKRKVIQGLRNKNDKIAVPMYTLFKTYMRVGSEMYYKLTKHKGLTTLKKSDIKIKGKNVTFNYLAKSGVPMMITKEFPASYVNRLNLMLRKLKKNDFVFVNEKGKPLSDKDFILGFKKYSGFEFYPHIVRSYCATKDAEEFLKTHRKYSKKEVNEFFMSVAEKLGHKRFVKKENTWKNSYNVTIHHYINPELVEKIKSRIV